MQLMELQGLEKSEITGRSYRSCICVWGIQDIYSPSFVDEN